ncbi:MAG: transcriptional repressor LexA [Chloroflexota bacterium]
MTKSSDKPRQVLEFVENFISKRGYAPSVTEIQRGLGITSSSVVAFQLKVLEREGLIKRYPRITRGLEVRSMGERARAVPLLGVIAAGQPVHVPAQNAWQAAALDMVQVPLDLIPTGVDVFALRVKGTSMIDAFILHGDIIILTPVSAVDDGQMVAVWLSDRDETTLKKLYREPDGRIRLQPANQTMDPIYVDAEYVEVQGKVIAVVRKLW